MTMERTTPGDPAALVCSHCAHCHTSAGGLECWREPPKLIGQAVFAPPVMAGGPPRPVWYAQAMRPPTRPEWSCGDFERKEGLVEPSAN